MNEVTPVKETEFEDLLYDVKDGIAKITINRPKALNALTGQTMIELVKAIEKAGDDRRVGVIVLTGAGDRAFSAGGDVRWEGGRAERPCDRGQPPGRA